MRLLVVLRGRIKFLPDVLAIISVGLALVVFKPASAMARTAGALVGAGYDTNVFETGNFPGAEQTEAFYTTLELMLYPRKFGREERFQFLPEGHLRWYPDASSGNNVGGSLSLSFKEAWKGEKSGDYRRRLSLAIEGYGEYDRALFLRRTIREDIGIGTVVPDLTMGELPSRSELGAELEVKGRTSKRLTLVGGLSARSRLYSDSSNLNVSRYSQLDDRQLGVELGVEINLPRKWEIGISGSFRNRVNPKREARDADGVKVPGVDRQFHYWDGKFEAVVDRKAFGNSAGFSIRRRSDRYQGYYSYDQIEFEDRVSVRATRTVDIELELLLGRRSYDVYAPSGSPLENDYVTVSFEMQKKFNRHLSVFLRPIYDANDSDDPVLDYDRTNIVVEVRGVR